MKLKINSRSLFNFLISEINKEFDYKNKNIQKRLIGFEDTYKIYFKDKGEISEGASSIMSSLFIPIITSYLFEYHHFVYTSLYSLLERSFIERLSEYLILVGLNNNSVKKIFERGYLKELVNVFVNEEVINKKDLSFIVELVNKRNAIAHKNFEKLSKKFNYNKKVAFYNADRIGNDEESLNAIFHTAEILVKTITKRLSNKTTLLN